MLSSGSCVEETIRLSPEVIQRAPDHAPALLAHWLLIDADCALARVVVGASARPRSVRAYGRCAKRIRSLPFIERLARAGVRGAPAIGPLGTRICAVGGFSRAEHAVAIDAREPGPRPARAGGAR